VPVRHHQLTFLFAMGLLLFNRLLMLAVVMSVAALPCHRRDSLCNGSKVYRLCGLSMHRIFPKCLRVGSLLNEFQFRVERMVFCHEK